MGFARNWERGSKPEGQEGFALPARARWEGSIRVCQGRLLH